MSPDDEQPAWLIGEGVNLRTRQDGLFSALQVARNQRDMFALSAERGVPGADEKFAELDAEVAAAERALARVNAAIDAETRERAHQQALHDRERRKAIERQIAVALDAQQAKVAHIASALTNAFTLLAEFEAEASAGLRRATTDAATADAAHRLAVRRLHQMAAWLIPAGVRTGGRPQQQPPEPARAWRADAEAELLRAGSLTASTAFRLAPPSDRDDDETPAAA